MELTLTSEILLSVPREDSGIFSGAQGSGTERLLEGYDVLLVCPVYLNLCSKRGQRYCAVFLLQ